MSERLLHPNSAWGQGWPSGPRPRWRPFKPPYIRLPLLLRCLCPLQGEPVMGFPNLFDSLFELADVWAVGVDPKDYADLLLVSQACRPAGATPHVNPRTTHPTACNTRKHACFHAC